METWRLARMMIELFDADANWYAEFRAADLRDQGELEDAKQWDRIVKAIEKLQPTKLVLVHSQNSP